MNTKEFRQWVELFALQSGLSIDRIEALILNAISAYVAKVQSHGKGAYITKLENGQFETFREWDLVADDCVMDDPERQWRVLDAVDEGFDEAEVGDTVNVLVASPEPSRTQPYLQFLGAPIPFPRNRQNQAWRLRIVLKFRER